MPLIQNLMMAIHIFTLIDTAGMRRKGKIDMPIERYSVMRSLRAVDRADVVLMVISAPEGVTEQDKKKLQVMLMNLVKVVSLLLINGI